MSTPVRLAAAAALALASLLAAAQPAIPPAAPDFDAELARRLGADEHGMRRYVLVILKTGPRRMPDGPAREAMFKGHFANMKRLAEAGQLVQAGPLDGVDGWRGLFVFAVADIEAARALTATDPVIAEGEMVAEYHGYYGTAALMQLGEAHRRLARQPF